MENTLKLQLGARGDAVLQDHGHRPAMRIAGTHDQNFELVPWPGRPFRRRDKPIAPWGIHPDLE